jgi:hypothetical protein
VISTCGQSAPNSRSSAGRTFAPTLWYVPIRSGPDSPEVGLCCLEARGDRVGVPEQQYARLGQRDRPWAAGPVDQPLADDALQRRDLLADRGLRVAELLGRATERAVLRDRLQGDQVTQFESEPVIRFHNQYEIIHDLCLSSGVGTLRPWQ